MTNNHQNPQQQVQIQNKNIQTATEPIISEAIEREQSQKFIEKALEVKPFKEWTTLTLTSDEFCSGLVTKIIWVERRVNRMPFQTCIFSHSAIVCETTRNKAYMIEFCDGYPVLIHDVTDYGSGWNFKADTKWEYGGFVFKRDEGVKVPVVSYNVQYVAKLFQCSADKKGEYQLSGNNCHTAQEQVRQTLKLAGPVELNYGNFIPELEIEFDPITEMKPYYYM